MFTTVSTLSLSKYPAIKPPAKDIRQERVTQKGNNLISAKAPTTTTAIIAAEIHFFVVILIIFNQLILIPF